LLLHFTSQSFFFLYSSSVFKVPFDCDNMAPSTKNEFSRTDLSTLSNYAAAQSTNIDLQWHIDFEKSVISGSVTHTIEVIVSNTQKVKFDSSKLHISGVSVNGAAATYERAESSPSLGTCLAVEIPSNLRDKGSQFEVTFHYSTDQEASAVQWLDSKATSSGKHPFVFTQVCCAPISYLCCAIPTQPV
jgi:leukotriene-A4 hydrolase